MTAASKITFIEITFIRMGYAAASQKHIYRNGYARRISRTHLQEWLCPPRPTNTLTGMVMPAVTQEHIYRNGYARCVPRTHICTGMGLPAASQKYIYRNGLSPPRPLHLCQGW